MAEGESSEQDDVSFLRTVRVERNSVYSVTRVYSNLQMHKILQYVAHFPDRYCQLQETQTHVFITCTDTATALLTLGQFDCYITSILLCKLPK